MSVLKKLALSVLVLASIVSSATQLWAAANQANATAKDHDGSTKGGGGTTF